MKTASYLLITLAIIFSSACSEDHGSSELPEVFDSLTRPYFDYNEVEDFYILKPWNYELGANSNRSYPLVIFLHGSGGAGNISYLSHIGYDNPDDDKDNETALAFQQEHPCFTLIPQTNSGWNNSTLIDLVENFKSLYRIDESRIYLIGYSMGGSGSYSFANSYNEYNNHLFAGIIRLAGQSQTVVRDAIAENTAIWLHIGLNDTEKRVQVTRDAYRFLQEFYSGSIETISNVAIEGYTGKVYTLTINGSDRFKRSEYENIGHGVASFPFKDPYLIEWLFKQRL